jgi:hypothetical protein
MNAPIVSAAAPVSMITFLRIVILLETFPFPSASRVSPKATFAMQAPCKLNL